jgi:ferrochelatase
MTPQRTGPRLAIILFNLGGPDKIASVRPFLLNLFTDRAILRVPGFVRFFLARLIAYRRTKPAQAIYALMGGKSPLRELTEAQAAALEATLWDIDAKCFVAMRYWHPFSEDVARQVRDWGPDEILLLPLYPQYSTTTTGSSLTAWREAAAKAGLVAPVTTLCCYHSDPGYTAATAAILRRSYDEARATLDPAIPLRVLFSAHGLPETIIKRGDPYQFQVERTVAAIVDNLDLPGLDFVICYQSRATPQRWIGPATDAEVVRAGADKVALLVMPVAFVSEHSETLVEIGMEYRELAHESGVPGYFRVPAQNSDAGFIVALADLVRKARGQGPGLCSFVGGRTCPRPHGDCPHARAALQTAA